jgi:hypothetical protein
MRVNQWSLALGLSLTMALSAEAEIIKGSMLVRGCEMS